MSTSVTFNGQSYSIPESGESGWGDEVSSFLIAVGTYAATNATQKNNIRESSASSVTVLSTDRTVVLTGTGDISVSLPSPTSGQMVAVVAGANVKSATITPNGSETINAGATYKIDNPRGCALLQFKSGNPGNWTVINLAPKIDQNLMVEFTAAAGGITAGDVVYITSTGAVAPASNSAEATAVSVTGVAVSTAAEGVTLNVQVSGKATIKNANFAGSIGSRVYLSSTAGESTLSAPSADDSVVVFLGHAISATEVVLKPQVIYKNGQQNSTVSGTVTSGTEVSLPSGMTYTNYEVEIFLNGMRLSLTEDYAYVGSVPRSKVTFTFDLVDGDKLSFKKSWIP